MEIKINSGSIFKNDYKTEDKHPDYKGKINCDGAVKDIALWVKKSESGKSYFSVSISEPYRKAEPPEGVRADEIGNDTSDLPF